MTTVPIHWWNSHPDICDNGDMWDQWWIKNELLAHLPGVQFVECDHELFADRAESTKEGGVLVIPGRFHNSPEDQQELIDYVMRMGVAGTNIVSIVTSDEESSLPITAVLGGAHWFMTPDPSLPYGKHCRFIGSMMPEISAAIPPREEPTTEWAFMGQITHEARRQMVESLKEANKRGVTGNLFESGGFTQGIEPRRYAQMMALAKMHPCPPGAVKPDSFRFYESLELGGLPIIDINDRKYWELVHGELPPVLYTDGWDKVDEAIDRGRKHWLRRANKAYAWWKREKFKMQQDLLDDLRHCGFDIPKQQISFLISCSPIISHPDTSIIEETIDSILDRTDNAPIYLMFDGVRAEQEQYRQRYEQHIRNVMIKYRHFPQVIPVIMDTHKHQAVMTRKTIRMVKTPLICFMEQDTPLVGEIDFEFISQPLLDKKLDMLRLHHEASILPPHEHLMLDHEDLIMQGGTTAKWMVVGVRRTVQWSQRPHVANTQWYQNILDTYFGWKSRTMIEDVMHGVVSEAWHRKGLDGWQQFRLAIYMPDGDIKRSTHTDGRGDDPKYDMTMAWDGERPELARPPD